MLSCWAKPTLGSLPHAASLMSRLSETEITSIYQTNEGICLPVPSLSSNNDSETIENECDQNTDPWRCVIGGKLLKEDPRV